MPRSPKKTPPKKKTRSKTKKPSHPPYKDMITEAIFEDKKWTKGSSRQAIVKYIVANYGLDEAIVRQKLRISLRRLADPKGDACLTQNGGCFRLTPEWKEIWKKKHSNSSSSSPKKKKKWKKNNE
jgi:histone H1/5